MSRWLNRRQDAHLLLAMMVGGNALKSFRSAKDDNAAFRGAKGLSGSDSGFSESDRLNRRMIFGRSGKILPSMVGLCYASHVDRLVRKSPSLLF